MVATHPPPPVPDVFVGLEALIVADAMRAFVESGLIDLLERLQPISSDDLARRAHMATRPVSLLMTVLAEAAVVRADGDGEWTLTGTAVEWKTMIANSIKPSFLDDGLGALDIGDPEKRGIVGGNYRTATGIIATLTRPTADSWAGRLARPGIAMLEVGAGAAPWTRSLLAAEPTMSATLVDLGPVLDEHRAGVREACAGSSLAFVPGDVFDVELTGRFDLVVVSAFCRLFPDEMNQQLFHHVAGWLRPEGTVVIADAIAAGERSRSLAVYELGLAARASSGRVYAIDDFERWLAEAGLCEPALHRTDNGAISILVASAPPTA